MCCEEFCETPALEGARSSSSSSGLRRFGDGSPSLESSLGRFSVAIGCAVLISPRGALSSFSRAWPCSCARSTFAGVFEPWGDCDGCTFSFLELGPCALASIGSFDCGSALDERCDCALPAMGDMFLASRAVFPRVLCSLSVQAHDITLSTRRCSCARL